MSASHQFQLQSKEGMANDIARHLYDSNPTALLGLDRELYAWMICRLRKSELVEIASRLGL